MSFDQTTFRFTIPMAHTQAEEAAEMVKWYDRALEEDGELNWGNEGLQECFGLQSESCLTAEVTDKGLQITWDTDADLEVAKTITESLPAGLSRPTATLPSRSGLAPTIWKN
jgi:predicted hydrolase (HD superfamily)